MRSARMDQPARKRRHSASSATEADVLIVGGGPAGLAAAVYLGRFRHRVVVVDAGESRAMLIAESRNCPGFPEGISGPDLLQRLRSQAAKFGATLVQDQASSVEPTVGGFGAETNGGRIVARKVFLATGIVDVVPAIPRLREAIAKGSVRLCPVCDGYEIIDRQVAVIGHEAQVLREALFLKQYTQHVTMLARYLPDFSARTRRVAMEENIAVCDAFKKFVPTDSGYQAILKDGEVRHFDVIYPAMGCRVRSELALAMGVECCDEGYVVVDKHQRTSVEGVYAIGDLVKALNQIAVAFGQAAIAATDVHNDLALGIE
ncbi:NAD(P)/FAD-dependent oxidoreductase [Mesorhizobium sp.]|uniref:NAD(P)/FAD-dependent oxidoreductase n=1 Tax=Mesorhizobium sp. TaxID=1871066 RepID=UPI0025EF6156|nr:NAD(P)/FAD-dependent oxidoreductase [Mesorhizobium sp.]